MSTKTSFERSSIPSQDVNSELTEVAIKTICPTESNRILLGLELGKIVEVVPETSSSHKQTNLIYSGSHTIYDLVKGYDDRLFFFDGSYSLRMIGYGMDKSEEIATGEFWDSNRQLKLNQKGTRLLFRKSDKVLLEFKIDEEKVIPSRGIRLDEACIADFVYNSDGKFVYIVTDDGILHFRSKNLDKDYSIDKRKFSSLFRRTVFLDGHISR